MSASLHKTITHVQCCLHQCLRPTNSAYLLMRVHDVVHVKVASTSTSPQMHSLMTFDPKLLADASYRRSENGCALQAASQIGSFMGPAVGGIVADVAGFR